MNSLAWQSTFASTRRPGEQWGRTAVRRVRRELIRAVDEIPPAPQDPGHGADPLAAGTTSTPDPVRTLLRTCLTQVVSGIAATSDRLSSVAALLTDSLARGLAASADPVRWRRLGYDRTPEPVTEVEQVFQVNRQASLDKSVSDLAHTVGEAALELRSPGR